METMDGFVIKNEVDLDYVVGYNDDNGTDNENGAEAADTIDQENVPPCGENDDRKLTNLLKEFDLEILFPLLKLGDITYRSLKYISAEDINVVIRHIGYRAEFREKLLQWRQAQSTHHNAGVLRSQSPCNNQMPVGAQQPNSNSTRFQKTPLQQHKNSANVANTAASSLHTMSNKKIVTIPTATMSAKRTLVSNTLEDSLDVQPSTSKRICIPSRDARESFDDTMATAISTGSSDPLSISGPGNTADKLLDVLTSINAAEIGQQQAKKKKFDLPEVLQQTVMGKDILEKYNRVQLLDDSDQTTLVRLIVDHFLYHDTRMDPKTMKEVSESIVRLFPSENLYTYYTPRAHKKRAFGKLNDRYFNVMHKRKQAMAIASGNASVKSMTNSMPTATGGEDENASDEETRTEHLEMLKIWLATNKTTDIQNVWQETASLRLSQNHGDIKHIFKDWPRYKDANGWQLIDIDFEVQHAGKKESMFVKIDLLETFAHKLHATTIRDKFMLKCYDDMNAANVLIDTKHYHLFNLLHAMILPPRLSKNYKPTITDAQRDMITHLQHIDDFEALKEDLWENPRLDNSEIKPKVIVVGESINQLKEFYVYADGLRYQLPTLLHAVDVVMKLYFVFNIDYSAKSRYVWMFLQEFIYDIPCIEKVPKITNIINRFNNI